jgi:hypothetical protein
MAVIQLACARRASTRAIRCVIWDFQGSSSPGCHYSYEHAEIMQGRRSKSTKSKLEKQGLYDDDLFFLSYCGLFNCGSSLDLVLKQPSHLWSRATLFPENLGARGNMPCQNGAAIYCCVNHRYPSTRPRIVISMLAAVAK